MTEMSMFQVIVLVAITILALWRMGIGGALFVAAAGTFLFAVGVPYMRAQDTVGAKFDARIHGHSLAKAREVLDKLEKGEAISPEDLALFEDSQYNRADLGHRLVNAEIAAMARRRGLHYGQFSIPSTVAVRDGEWHYTGKVVCGKARVVAWGKITSDLQEPTLNWLVDPNGWVKVNPDGSLTQIEPDQRLWGGFQEVVPDAPFMASLIRAGRDGVVFYGWKQSTAGIDKYEAYVEALDGKSTVPLYWAINDWVLDKHGTQRDFFANNWGQQGIGYNNPNGGIQAEIFQEGTCRNTDTH